MSPDMPLCSATVAEYFRLGIQSALVRPEEARTWAMALIERQTAPCGEIIDVAWSKTSEQLDLALRSIPGERDAERAGNWLLGLLRASLAEFKVELSTAIRQARQVANSSSLSFDVCYCFDRLQDELCLAEANTYGTVEGCRSQFEDALTPYPPPPTFGET